MEQATHDAKQTSLPTAVRRRANSGSSVVAAELGTSLSELISSVSEFRFGMSRTTTTPSQLTTRCCTKTLIGILQSMDRSLPDKPETGVVDAIHQVESSVIKSVRKHRP